MMKNSEIIELSQKGSGKVNSRNNWLLISFFAVSISASFFGNFQIGKSLSPFLSVICTFVIYIIICLLILNNKNDLSVYHIDKFSLFIFTIFGALLYVQIAGLINNFMGVFASIYLIFVAIVLTVLLLFSKIQLDYSKILNFWNGIGLLCGIIYPSLFIFLAFVILNVNMVVISHHSWLCVGWYFIKMSFWNLSYVAIGEEPIFRGFLWGVLKNHKLKDTHILVVQGVLFWISHYKYWNNPLVFWGSLPLFSLLLGFLAWKSKSIFPPLIAHALYNAVIATSTQIF